jgi:uncharacterized membrane protein
MRREMIYTEPVGQRVGRFLALLLIIFVVVAAVVVTQRLAAETLALIVGLLMAGVPLLAIIILGGLIIARRPRRDNQTMTIPPIIVQMPQQPQSALPDYGQMLDLVQTSSSRNNNRAWEVIGYDGND